MNLTRCNHGHFYDMDKFESCPHCKKQGNGHYGIIYFNKKTREIFINEYCDLSHFSYTHYNDENIVNLSTILEHRGLEVNISNMMKLITEGDF